ncbi:hypothetical protein BHYA_0082g00460 [Botrytis hyacinthi]|uniref:O-methyltransferase C-terminal domain-containing protein n=1 Tax=Botrytis hyacinthi TaxID=278943 RepID=A0A4Z1GXT5_9HELO|nr:hypothetical protein BHYA_0082g00460 [Botrytis hyacinthi]
MLGLIWESKTITQDVSNHQNSGLDRDNSKHTSKFDEYLASNNIPSPSFDVSAPLKLSLPPDIQDSRNAVLEASDELTALMLGPVESLIPLCDRFITIWDLRTIFHPTQASSDNFHGLTPAKSFPPTRISTFPAIAQKCSIPESDARSLIRHAMSFYIFHEPSPWIIAHTASSKALAEIPSVSDFIDFVSDEMLPASTRLVDAMIKWPGSRSQQMGKAMAFLKSRPSESVQRVLESHSWGDAANGLTVDVGGAKGTVGIELLIFLPKLKCIVQGRLEVVGDTTIPDDLQDRLSFMAHDFFGEQPVKEANLYLICNVLHDWSDKYAARILQNLIPALKRGARILVCDRVLPAPCTLTPYQMRRQRADDLYMKGIQDARVRDPNDWEQLFASVDEIFKPFQVETVDGSELSTICATWEGEDMFEV